MKGKLNTLAIVLLATMNVLTFVYVSQTTTQLSNLKRSIDDKTSKVVIYQAKDGYTPVKGIDYFDGSSGINAVSYSRTETVVKEVPLMGNTGDEGKTPPCYYEDTQCRGTNAATQELRINPYTGDLESKLTDADFWTTLVPCAQLQVGCPE